MSVFPDCLAMKSYETLPVLNRLLNCLSRSLPAYLAETSTYENPDSAPIRAAIDRLASDQRRYADRVAEAIVARGGRPNPGRFPREFTAKNDLSVSYLLHDVIDLLDQDIALFEQYAKELEGAASLHALAEEILGNAKGHLDALLELAKNQVEAAGCVEVEG